MALVPKHIRNLAPYKAGKSIDDIRRELGLEYIIKLASNENPYGVSPKAIKALKKSLNDCFRYPDPSAYHLKGKLAECFNVKDLNITVGSGSEGVMSNIMRTFLRQGDEIIAAQNSFIGFRVLANASGHYTNWVPLNDYRHDLPKIAEKINEYTKIIYLANPDNPTGTYFTKNEFDIFMTKIPERVLVLLDEAYFEYANHIEDYPDSMHYRYDNVITLRTFSKAHGLAGFRAGYGFAHDELIDNLNKVKLPFEPSWPAQVCALAALEDSKFINKTIKRCLLEKEKLYKIFDSLSLKYIKSATNFITLLFNTGQSAELFCNEMLSKGIILRHLNKWGLPSCVRVTIGTQEENEYFIKFLTNYYIK